MTSKPSYEFDRDFQRDVLYCLLDKQFLMENRRVLHEDHFTNPEHGIIAATILYHYDEYGAPPSKGVVLETFRKELKGVERVSARREFTSLLELEHVNTKKVGQEVRTFAATSAAHALFAEFDTVADNGGLGKFQSSITTALDLRLPPTKVTPYKEGLEARFKAYKQGYNKIQPMPTKVGALDKALLGGLDKGEMGLLIGLPGMGKTHLVVHFGACAVEAGYKVYHFSLEMSKRAILRRYDTRLTGVSVKEIARKYKKYARDLSKFPLMVSHHYAYELSVDELRATIDRLGAPDLLIVDYPALLTGASSNPDATRHVVENNYLQMRNIAGQYNCAVWTPFQSNRAGHQVADTEYDHITKQNLAEAYGPARHADVIISWNQTIGEREEGRGRIWIDKNRDVDNVESDQVSIPVTADWGRSYVE